MGRHLLQQRLQVVLDDEVLALVEELVLTGGRVTGARGSVLASDGAARGVASSRDVIGAFGSGAPIPGLFAAGEASGFGGGGAHGYRALEGTFLGGCLFSGRQAGRAAAALG